MTHHTIDTASNTVFSAVPGIAANVERLTSAIPSAEPVICEEFAN